MQRERPPVLFAFRAVFVSGPVSGRVNCTLFVGLSCRPAVTSRDVVYYMCSNVDVPPHRLRAMFQLKFRVVVVVVVDSDANRMCGCRVALPTLG